MMDEHDVEWVSETAATPPEQMRYNHNNTITISTSIGSRKHEMVEFGDNSYIKKERFSKQLIIINL